MQNRYSIKIVGASGQGINVIGEILNKGLKRSGYNTFAYREYPSLIKGGHSTYQIDISSENILSSTKGIDLLMILNRQATKWHLDEVNESSQIIHDIDNPRINNQEYASMKEKKINLLYVPAYKLSKEQGGNELTANIVMIGILWRLLNLDNKVLIQIVSETFKNKPDLLQADLKCAEEGYSYDYSENLPFTPRIIKEDEIDNQKKLELHKKADINNLLLDSINNSADLKNNYLISGNELIGLGAINAGVRIYYAYPMTPASSILTFMADNMSETGIIVKQAEDEITAAAMSIGSMHIGARSLTGTSGGGFDLMAEHISLAGMIEVPMVIILAQRPGPATGMPTWTGQGDLMASIFTGHGEFARCVISVKDGEDCFYAIQEAFNIAEKYQIPVILLTDKLIAESIYSIKGLDENKIKIDRGELVTNSERLKILRSTDRYRLEDNGISPRWLPGSDAEDFNANSDEHTEDGAVTEDSEASMKMIEKRLLKLKTLESELNEPLIYSNGITSNRTLKILSWGSTFGVISDVMNNFKSENIRVDLLHIKYLWPLKTGKLLEFIDENTILIEGNYNGQLSELIKMKTGLDVKHKILKWDGRPFFTDELINLLKRYI